MNSLHNSLTLYVGRTINWSILKRKNFVYRPSQQDHISEEDYDGKTNKTIIKQGTRKESLILVIDIFYLWY